MNMNREEGAPKAEDEEEQPSAQELKRPVFELWTQFNSGLGVVFIVFVDFFRVLSAYIYWSLGSVALGLVVGENMTYPLFVIFRLFLGTLYPAYESYKAVRTKNVREYVKWMMYWIVFAVFTGIESFTDIFIAFWFPFYYEMKIIMLLWLLSPVSKGSLGSSILYRKFVHPTLMKHEDEIDRYLTQAQEQGYNTLVRLCRRGFTYISNMVMQTAIKGGGGLIHQLKKSYSLSDLGNLSDEGDFREGSAEPRAVQHRSERQPNEGLRTRGRVKDQPRGNYTISESESSRIRGSSSQKDHFSQLQQQHAFPSGDLSSGYSSTSEFLPVSPDEVMDTGDYELYDPRVHTPLLNNHSSFSSLKSYVPSTPTQTRASARNKSKEFPKEGNLNRQDRFYEKNFPLTHSASLPMSNLRDDQSWIRSSSSVTSSSASSSTTVYPDDDDDDSDLWSDSFENPSVTVTELSDNDEGDNEGDRTPQINRAGMIDLQEASEKLKTLDNDDQKEGGEKSRYLRTPSAPIDIRPSPPPRSASALGLSPSRRSRGAAPQPPTTVTDVSNPPTQQHLTVAKEKSGMTGFLQRHSPLSRDPTPLTTTNLSGTSPSKCPHCTIHTWLPHSQGCPNYGKVKKPKK